MLARVLHKLVARPAIYDLAQTLAGSRLVQSRVAARAPTLLQNAIILDIGGGTGVFRHMWPGDERCRYICVDLDAQKLAGFRAKFPRDAAILADAARLPIADASADAAACTLVSHHLTDHDLDRVLSQAARALKPGGTFLFADAVWRPMRLPSRALWRLDRGAFPRTADALRSAIALHFKIAHWEEFAAWHRYVVCVARR